ncbi:hypothetical protein CPLU01_12229 [Colletotrichum plurivorum]|uniref:CFEM domain-containing protein n=1 Tax=Colletotrichum plurivorum TaxID=2175906 RepID=A0A8H6K0C0_9PEZI|nr:hypothetical protein CPLU01_12229 [Colletotrichum plurivorum]
MRSHCWLRAVTISALAILSRGQLDSLPACGISCVNAVIAKGFGCASQDNVCLCKQQDFVFGVRDCASQACGAEIAPKVNDYVTSLCATATRETPSSAPTQSQPPSPTPPLPASPAPTLQTTLPPPNTAKPAGVATSLSQPIAPSPLEPGVSSRRPSGIAQPSQLPSNIPTTLSTSAKSVSVPKLISSTATGGGTSHSGTASDVEQGNIANGPQSLSVPAKAGIGVAAGVGVLAIGLALYLLIRRPKNRARSMQISGPMPGSGRDYSGGYSGGMIGMTSKNYSELEMRSRRYEEMIPRQSPRRVM